MPANTPIRHYPYPLDSDRIDVAGDIKRLAMALDSDIGDQIGDVADKVSRRGDTMTGMLTLPNVDPTSGNHAVRKSWVDRTFVHVIGDTLTGPLVYANTVANNELDSPNAITRRSWQIATFVNIDGDTMTGVLTLSADSDTATGARAAMPRSWIVDQVNTRAPLNSPNFNNVFGAGATPNSGNGVRFYEDGVGAMAHNSNGITLSLRKGPSANAVNQVYINFESGAAPGQQIGHIDIGPDTTHVRYNTTSDHRLKEDLGPIADAAPRVQSLARRAFCGRWRKSGTEGDFINAHDIASVAPYAVSGDKDGPQMQMVSYGDLVPLLVAALGNALDRIDSLEAVG